MAVTAYAAGTQAATVGTEHTLAAPNVASSFTLHVDTAAMTWGDILEFRIYQMVLTAGQARVAYYARFEGAQPTDDVIKISVPVSNELTDVDALRFTLKQTKGVTHDYPWKVLQYT